MSDTVPKRGRGRPRREGADEAILEIVRAILVEDGFAKLNVDEVAERAGVAKTTIYRRWPSKSALAAATLPPAPSGGDARSILRETEESLAPFAGADDGELMGIIRAILRPRREALAKALRDEHRADEMLGALWMRIFVVNR